MKKAFKKKGRYKLLGNLGMILVLVMAVLWLEPARIRQHVMLGFQDKVKQWTIWTLQNSNIKVAYVSRDDSGVAEKIADKVSRSNNMYSFVEYQISRENIVTYQPPVLAEESESVTKESEKQPTDTTMVAKQPETAKVSPKEGEKQTTNPVVETFSPIFPMTQLQDFDFLLSNLYIVPKRAKVIPEDLNAGQLLEMDMKINKDASKPQILIYHTHGSETFADSGDDVKGTGIIAVGAKLATLLSDTYGYNVIHCTEIFDNVNGVFDRSKAYDYSREAVQQILTDHPSIEVIIDLHRDGVSEETRLVTDINGKPTAQIMFFNGVSRSSATGDIDYLYNQYRNWNLAFSLQAKLEAMAKYPDFTRKNYIDAYQYNLDLKPRAMLIEAGAQNNTLQEELNAMEPLADILNSVLSGESRSRLEV